MTANVLDVDVLRVELARRKMTQLELSKKLGIAYTTLNGYTRGRHPYPSDLPERIEKALGLRTGFLRAKVSR